MTTPSDQALARQLRIFSLLYVLAGWFHLWNQVPWPGKTWWTPPLDQLLFECGMLGAALAVLAMPRDPRPFLVFLAFEVLHVFADFPRVANHWFITGLLDLAMLGSAAVVWRREGALSPAAWLRHFGPAVRWLLVIAYSFAALAKFNTDFTDPAVSCASTTWTLISAEFLRGLPDGLLWHWLSIVATLVAEVAIPALLLTKGWRHLGVLAGLGFHYLISVPPQLHVPDFASLLFAVWFLFLPVEVSERMYARRDAAVQDATRPRALVVGLLAPVVLLPLLWYAIGPEAHRAANALAWSRIWTFAVTGAAWCIFVLLTLRDPDGHVGAQEPPMRLTHPWHLTLVVVVVLSGLTPYLGLRTTTNFTMFSNMKTEGGTSNHLFMPQVYLSDRQLDLVRVRASNVRSLELVVDKGLLLPWWELRYRYQEALAEGVDATVTYERAGEVVSATGPADAGALLEPIGWLDRKVSAYRGVEDGPSTCHW